MTESRPVDLDIEGLVDPVEVGIGGFATVYRASQPAFRRTVAVKVMPPDLATDPQFRARFDHEARAISQLQHPHICTLHDITVTDPTPPTTIPATVPPTSVPATVAAVTTAPATDAPTTTVAAAAATNELPRTGGGNGEAAAFGAIVVAAGLALVGGARFRRRHA